MDSELSQSSLLKHFTSTESKFIHSQGLEPTLGRSRLMAIQVWCPKLKKKKVIFWSGSFFSQKCWKQFYFQFYYLAVSHFFPSNSHKMLNTSGDEYPSKLSLRMKEYITICNCVFKSKEHVTLTYSNLIWIFRLNYKWSLYVYLYHKMIF